MEQKTKEMINICYRCTSECDLYKTCDSPSKVRNGIAEFSKVKNL